jgi:hypothetical protein
MQIGLWQSFLYGYCVAWTMTAAIVNDGPMTYALSYELLSLERARDMSCAMQQHAT